MAGGIDTRDSERRKVGRDVFAPPSVGNSAAPMFKTGSYALKLAQNHDTDPILQSEYDAREAGIPSPPPAGWPTTMEMVQKGPQAFDKALSHVVKPNEYNTSPEKMYEDSRFLDDQKTIRRYHKIIFG